VGTVAPKQSASHSGAPPRPGKPIRIRLRRTRGFCLQAESREANGLEAVKVDRTTGWGNPHIAGYHGTVEECIAKFRADLAAEPEFVASIRRRLAGKNLACWCKIGNPCHADVLLEVANEKKGQTDGKGKEEGGSRRRKAVQRVPQDGPLPHEAPVAGGAGGAQQADHGDASQAEGGAGAVCTGCRQAQEVLTAAHAEIARLRAQLEARRRIARDWRPT